MLTLLSFILSHGQVSCLIINNLASIAVFAVMQIFLSKYKFQIEYVSS